MSDTSKRSMFGRMFGGGKTEAPPKKEEQARPLHEPAAAVSEEFQEEAARENSTVGVFGRMLGGKAAPKAEEALPPDEPASDTEELTGEAPEKTSRFGWFQRLRQGLTKTSSRLTEGITGVFAKQKLDDETLEQLEDLLIQADLGLNIASRVTDTLRQSRYNSNISSEEVRDILAQEVEKVLAPVAEPLEVDLARKPHVILVVGVNGTGKTTTIGKYANQFARQGYRVMLAAGDTFRAAAIEQLKIWGDRTGSEVVASEPGADAASLAFDAFQRAKAEGYDVLIIDTAGRLQNKSALMAELEKIIRVIRKLDRAAPHSVLLTLDATTGQNALSQVEIFDKTAGVTGLVMTKLDGTARGGILVAIASKYGIPVHAVGIGEGVEDLQSFDARDFARAIAGVS
jgi:fused signal recognition particle receptor